MTYSRRVSALILVPALTLAACGGGGGSSDKDQISKIITDGAKDPQTICDNVIAAEVKQLGGRDKCRELAKAQNTRKTPKVTVDKVTISGEKATANITTQAAGKQVVKFVKESGDWKVINN